MNKILNGLLQEKLTFSLQKTMKKYVTILDELGFIFILIEVFFCGIAFFCD